MPARPHILVVDDDSRLRDLLRRFLGEHGYRVTAAGDAAGARRCMEGLRFDLLVLDIMMPGESGLELTSALRERSAVPVLLLSALGDTDNRIDGLERGADDFLAKPFEPRELLARIRTILRRAPPEIETAQEIRFGFCRFDIAGETLLRHDEAVRLTTAEARLLRILAHNAGSPVSRESLCLESGIGANARAVDVQVTRLRRKIEEDPRSPRHLRTVRGKGYVLWPD